MRKHYVVAESSLYLCLAIRFCAVFSSYCSHFVPAFLTNTGTSTEWRNDGDYQLHSQSYSSSAARSNPPSNRNTTFRLAFSVFVESLQEVFNRCAFLNYGFQLRDRRVQLIFFDHPVR